MSVQEIKQKLATLPRKEQDEVIAFLFHLRHADDAEYRSNITQCNVKSSGGGKPGKLKRGRDVPSRGIPPAFFPSPG